MKTIKKTEQELILKERRVSYWEKFGIIISMKDLVFFNELKSEVKL